MLVFPDAEIIDWWVEYLPESENIPLKESLPKIDKEWRMRVMSVISLIKMNYESGYSPQDLHHLGALIFYKINKAHNEIDGNKRSSIIITYLFYLMNDYAIREPEEMRLLAKRVARSKGKKNQDAWLHKISGFLSTRVIKLS